VRTPESVDAANFFFEPGHDMHDSPSQVAPGTENKTSPNTEPKNPEIFTYIKLSSRGLIRTSNSGSVSCPSSAGWFNHRRV
jgi:hypothetical protein